MKDCSKKCGKSCNRKNRYACLAQVGRFDQEELLAELTQRGIALGEELRAQIAADFAERQNKPGHLQKAALRVAPEHHEHCHRALGL